MVITVTYRPHRYGRLSASPFNGRSLHFGKDWNCDSLSETDLDRSTPTTRPRAWTSSSCPSLWSSTPPCSASSTSGCTTTSTCSTLLLSRIRHYPPPPARIRNRTTNLSWIGKAFTCGGAVRSMARQSVVVVVLSKLLITIISTLSDLNFMVQ